MQIHEELKKRDKDLATLKATLQSIQIKIDNAYDDKLSGNIDNEVFQRIYQKLLNEQKDIRNKISDLDNSDKSMPFVDEQKIKEFAERFVNAKDFSRELFVSLIDRIELTESKELKIFFKFRQMDIANHLL